MSFPAQKKPLLVLIPSDKDRMGCLDILIPVIPLLINTALLKGTPPKPLKCAAVKPFMKQRGLDPNVVKNYRPVSKLPYLSKLSERVVVDELIEHLDRHSLLDRFQSAYRVRHSTEPAVLRVLNDIICSADRGDLVLLVLLDFTSASV